MSSRNGWIGVDLDGTLAEYGKFQGHSHIGAPVPAMAARVRRWLIEGRDVRILTARVSGPQVDSEVFETIQDWCLEHLGQALPVTCEKDYQMIELWDDRAVQVEKNTGRMIGYSGAGLEPHPPIGATLTCNRHLDCSKAPKGQLCCFDPNCKMVDCQVRR